MHKTPRQRSREKHLTELLLAGRLSAEAVSDVVDAGLGAYALARLGDDVVHDAALLRTARLVAGVRHTAIRRAVVELVGAWNAAGLDTLMFKGFYLAEFVYPDPSWRAYGDVDLALRSRRGSDPRRTAALAADVARDLGFTVVWRLGEQPSVHSFHDEHYDGHELVQLVHPATGVSLDAHKRLVHSNVSLRPQSDKGEVLTSKVWDAALPVDFGGVPALVPAPIDSALVGLIAGRSWSGDRYALKPHDLLDLEMLMRHGGFGHDELLSRARSLGMAATTKLFLRRCDPVVGVVDLRPPGGPQVFAYDTLLATERSHRGLAQAWATALAAPGRLRDVVRELPAAARQVARVRGGAALEWPQNVPQSGRESDRQRIEEPVRESVPESVHESVGRSVTKSVRMTLDRRTWRASQIGVRRALRLLGMAPEHHAELARACLLASVVRRGFQVVRVEKSGKTWLEYEGRVLPLDQLGLVGEASGPAPSPDSSPARAARPSRTPAAARQRIDGQQGHP